jgi:hypothetical protein
LVERLKAILGVRLVIPLPSGAVMLTAVAEGVLKDCEADHADQPASEA